MKRLLFFLAALVVIAVVILGYLGFVPVVSSLFGSDKPRDLGMTWSQEDLQSARGKTGVQLAELLAGTAVDRSLVYEGERPVNARFTSQELTALLNNSPWAYYPLTDCQVLINDDGTVEGSAIVRIDLADEYAAATNLSGSAVTKVLDKFWWVKSNPAVYFKASAQVADDDLSGEIISLQVGRMPVPIGWITSYENAALSFLEERIDRVPGLRADEVKFADGEMLLRGTLPAVERTVR